MYNIGGDLQTAADAAAIAGATVLTTDEMMAVREGGADGYVLTEIGERSRQVCGLNGAIGISSLLTGPDDITAGRIDLNTAGLPFSAVGAPKHFNAVRVSVRCEEESPNGPVGLFFARIFGTFQTDIAATATAAFDDRFIGFVPPPYDNPLVPFTVHEDVFAAGGPDAYGYDLAANVVTEGGDGVQEINLYPHAEIGNGNFGLLNIGTPNQGTSELSVQIEDGVPPEDVEAEIGSTELSFVDESGDPVTYSITGNPGLHSALASSIELRMGDVLAILVHDGYVAGGANMVFHITGIRFVRLMASQMRGGQKSVWLQPVSYAGGGVHVGPTAPSSGGLAGKLVLVR